MKNNKKHIVWVLANNTSAPYFSWFAERFVEQNETDRLSFVCLFPTPPQMVEEMGVHGLKCYWVKYNPKNRKRGLLKNAWCLFWLFRKIKPDVVNTHLFDDSLAGIVGAWLARTPKRVVTRGDAGYHYHFTPKWVVFDKLINHLATHVVAISTESKQFILEKEKASPEKVILIHHGIPTELYQNPSKQFMTEFKKQWKLEDKFVVGTVSRFIDWKGYKDIVKVAELIAPQIPTICFLLIGKGEQKDEIIALIKEKGLGNHFCLPGYIQPENMPSVYGMMNAYLHAARMEPFGFVIAEAIAAGLPVVSTPTGAALDAIQTGENGWLAEYNHPEQLANYLLEVKQQNIEIPWKKAQETALKRYDFQIMYENYVNLYLK